MEVEYVLEIDDALAFHRYHWKHGPLAQRLRRGGWGTLVVLCLLIAVMATLELSVFGQLSEMVVVLLCALGGLVLLTLLQIFSPWFAERNVRQIFKGSAGKGEFRHRRLTLSVEGLRSVTEVTDSKMKWAGIEKVAVTDEHLFLYTSPTAAIIVPKRVFDDEWRFAEFADHARQYHEQRRV